MEDMRNGRCALCGHQEVLRFKPHYVYRNHRGFQATTFNPLGGHHGAMAGATCARCGYTQWFMEDADEVLAGEGRHFVEVITARPDARYQVLFDGPGTDDRLQLQELLDGMGLVWDIADVPCLVKSQLGKDEALALRDQIRGAGGRARICAQPRDSHSGHPFRGDGPAPSAVATLECTVCGQAVPKQQTYMTARGPVCDRCYSG